MLGKKFYLHLELAPGLDTKLQSQLRMSFHWSIIYTVPQTLRMTIEELTAKIRPCERKKCNSH